MLSLRHFPPLSTTKAWMTWTENTFIYMYVCVSVCVIFPCQQGNSKNGRKLLRWASCSWVAIFSLRSDMIIKIKHAWVGNCLIKFFLQAKLENLRSRASQYCEFKNRLEALHQGYRGMNFHTGLETNITDLDPTPKMNGFWTMLLMA